FSGGRFVRNRNLGHWRRLGQGRRWPHRKIAVVQRRRLRHIHFHPLGFILPRQQQGKEDDRCYHQYHSADDALLEPGFHHVASKDCLFSQSMASATQKNDPKTTIFVPAGVLSSCPAMAAPMESKPVALSPARSRPAISSAGGRLRGVGSGATAQLAKRPRSGARMPSRFLSDSRPNTATQSPSPFPARCPARYSAACGLCPTSSSSWRVSPRQSRVRRSRRPGTLVPASAITRRSSGISSPAAQKACSAVLRLSRGRVTGGRSRLASLPSRLAQSSHRPSPASCQRYSSPRCHTLTLSFSICSTNRGGRSVSEHTSRPPCRRMPAFS